MKLLLGVSALPVHDCDTVDLVTEDHGVGEPVEQVLGGQQGHPLQ